jgi:hypothetical protein
VIADETDDMQGGETAVAGTADAAGSNGASTPGATYAGTSATGSGELPFTGFGTNLVFALGLGMLLLGALAHRHAGRAAARRSA